MRWFGGLAFFGIVGAVVVVSGAEPVRKPDPRWAKTLDIGSPAPEFALPVLKSEKNAAGETVERITDEEVNLSDFRGKKIVCLFTSSYT